MGRRRAAHEVVDLTDSAAPSGASAGAGPHEVMDLTQNNEPTATPPSVAPAAAPAAAKPPKRKRKSAAAAAAAGEASGSAAAAAPAAAEPPKRKLAAAAAGAPGAAAAASQPSPGGRKMQKAVKEQRTNECGRKKQKVVKEKRQNEHGRTVPYSARASQKVQERIARTLPGSGHRLFLISRNTVAPLGAEGGPVEEFVVLGATGSVYTIKLGKHPSCSCPDAAKGNLCKHLLFVMLRVLRLPQDDPLVWQRALLKAEAEEVLSGIRSTRAMGLGVHASDAVQRAYRQATGGAAAAGDEEAAGSQAPKRPVEDAECAICFDDLQDGALAAQKAIVTCESCGNHLHKECFSKWVAAKRQQGIDVTCVYCRSKWVDPAAAPGAAAGASGNGSGYLNLAHASEEHRSSQSLDELYGASAVWINYHSRGGGNRRHAASMYNQLRGW